MSTHAEQLTAAEKAIKGGWIAALISLGMTALIMLISLMSPNADLGAAFSGAGLELLIDLALIAVLAFFIWRKSRTAATLMFLYFLASKIIQIAAGDYRGIFMGAVFLFFYGRAVWGTFTWHKLRGKQDAVEVFSDPVSDTPKDGKLFK